MKTLMSLVRPLQLRAMILRKFKSEGDVELAQQLVFDSNGIQRARDLAAEHATLAAQAVSHTSTQVLHADLSLTLLHLRLSLPALASPTDTLAWSCMANALLQQRKHV